jgi:hypothetical protein
MTPYILPLPHKKSFYNRSFPWNDWSFLRISLVEYGKNHKKIEKVEGMLRCQIFLSVTYYFCSYRLFAYKYVYLFIFFHSIFYFIFPGLGYLLKHYFPWSCCHWSQNNHELSFPSNQQFCFSFFF